MAEPYRPDTEKEKPQLSRGMDIHSRMADWIKGLSTDQERIVSSSDSDDEPSDPTESEYRGKLRLRQRLEWLHGKSGFEGPSDDSPIFKRIPHSQFGMTGSQKIVHQYNLSIIQKYKSEWSSLSGEKESVSALYNEPLLIERNVNDCFRNISVDGLFHPHASATVVLQGDSGSGKSFIGQKIMLDWASKEFSASHFYLVFYLRCEELMCISEEMNLFELLSYSCSLTSDQISQILQQSPWKVLFIIDGVDELRLKQDIYDISAHIYPLQNASPDVILCGLMRRSLIPESKLLVTTRTRNTVNKLLKGKTYVTEIMGFSEKTVEMYFQKYFRKEYERMRANETLLTACSIPVVRCIISEIFKVGSNVTNGLETTTSIYIDFVSILLEHHCQDLSQSVQSLLKSLGQLAERGMLEQEVMFDEKTVNETISDPAGIPFLCKFLSKRRIHQETMFSFMHFSFQEFFTALYYVLLDEKDSQSKMNEVLHTVETGWALSYWPHRDFSKADVEVRHAKLLQPVILLIMDHIPDAVVDLVSVATEGKILNKLNIKKIKNYGKLSGFPPKITVSVRDGDIMLSFGTSEFTSATELTLTSPRSLISTINWMKSQKKLSLYNKDEEEEEVCLLTFLQSVFDLKKVCLQDSDLTDKFTFKILSLIQACPSLTELSMNVKDQFMLEETQSMKISLEKMGWTLSIWGKLALIKPYMERFTEEKLKTKWEKSEGETGESSDSVLQAYSFSEAVEVFTPKLSGDEDNTYRFVCPHAGQFRCSLTSLVFVMEGEAEVLYKVVSWDPGLLDGLGQMQPAGPLYSIDCFAKSVSQLHLPHCVIFSEENKDGLAVVHFTGGNVEIIQPLKVTETHVIIDIRELSHFGLIWIKTILGFPIDGQVLLFLRTVTFEQKEKILNVHLLPGNVPVSEVQRLHHNKSYIETSSKCRLFTDRQYSLCCQPEDCEVQPMSEMFQLDNFGPNYHPTFEVFLDNNIKEVRLGVLDKTENGKEVWPRRRVFLTALSKGGEPPTPKTIPETEFVNTHRDKLIDRVTSAMAIADSLKSKNMIAQEMWNKIQAAEPRQKKMRLLLDALESGGNDAKFRNLAVSRQQPKVLINAQGTMVSPQTHHDFQHYVFAQMPSFKFEEDMWTIRPQKRDQAWEKMVCQYKKSVNWNDQNERSFFSDEGVSLAALYTEPEIIQKNEGGFQNVSVEELFYQTTSIILQGNSGSGKSFIAQKIMMDWSSEKHYLKYFDLAFYLRCEEMKCISKEMSLIELLSWNCSLMSEQISEMLKNSAQRVLFIIDGLDDLDELRFMCNEFCISSELKRAPPEVIVGSLVKQQIFPTSFKLITTRTDVPQGVLSKGEQCSSRIVGFSEKGVEEYFQKFFQNEEIFRKAFVCVRANENLITACSIPINCWIICLVMQQRVRDGEDVTIGLETTTSIYVDFVSTLLEHNSQGLSQSVPSLLRSLGQLAERGMLEQQVLFDEKTVYETISDPPGSPFLFLSKRRIHQDTMFSFFNYSFQEFFTALYYVLLDEEESQRKVKELLHTVERGWTLSCWIQEQKTSAAFPKSFCQEIFTSIEDKYFMLCFRLSVSHLTIRSSSLISEVALTCSRPEMSTTNWRIFLQKLQSSQFSSADGFYLQGVLQSVSGLKKVHLQIQELTVRWISTILLLVQAFSSLNELGINSTVSFIPFKIKQSLGKPLTQKGWTLIVQRKSVLIVRDRKSFTEEELKTIKTENIESKRAESSSGQSSSGYAKVFTPERVQEDGEDKPKTFYRFVCPHAGQFQCSLTSLVFVMEGEGEVLFRVVSWDPRLLDGLGQMQPAGPLYNIDCFNGSISGLHLPHCEILSGNLAVARFTGGNVEIMKPRKVTEAHVVIDIRDLSHFGLFKKMFFPPSPVVTQVLLFLRPITARQCVNILDVHLLPWNVPLSEVKDQHRESTHIKTSSKCSLTPGSKYSLGCEPRGSRVQPETEKFECNFGPNYHPTFEVLSLLDRTKGKEVWEPRHILITGKDADPSAHKRLTECEFVKKHRKELIQRVSSVMVIADGLRTKDMIPVEMYNKVRAAVTPQEKVRLLLDALDSGGAAVKAEFYRLLKENECYIVDELESGHSGPQ
ncbi:hypothetical protein Q8A67_008714 [Cirrhinus molitorella]|uniref:Uncharacterized protein n=1 Tax=Cirrhinus molitorella TaxID=172907 RepID=A0AA88Q0H7_9TELE|nr:hypothetical protein Q8A67_008714 [Cirrhinus molitorella]